MGNRRDVDMTQGNIFAHLIHFALPLLIGNIFQQLYNMVDTWVVGNYVSDAALAAVGTVGPIINMLVGFFSGFSSGVSVVIAQNYGAKNYQKVDRAVHTAAVMTLIFSFVLTAIGVLMVPLMLRLINMPSNVIPEATTYLTIIFAGISGMMIYNLGSGILRAVGDSTRPFYFLLAAAIINTVLDLVFVLLLDMGVSGVAYATIIAQGISALLIVITLLRTKNCIKLTPKHFCLDRDILKKMIVVGMPAAFQMTITSFSNVFVQSYINYFGDLCMGGWTAYSKIDMLLFMPMQSVALAVTTFVGQNLGKNQPQRAKEGVRKALYLTLAITVVVMIPVMIFAPSLVYFFNKNQVVIDFGTRFLRTITPFYICSTFNQIYASGLRGAGNSMAPMAIMLSSFVGFRQLYLFIMSRLCNTIFWISMSYPAGWILCSVLTVIYYARSDFAKTRLVE
ncbi:MAG: MATE family efflux transporter [Clostridia bacterium]|nr:MATE family efflux transporter [Clostridia bacterium]